MVFPRQQIFPGTDPNGIAHFGLYDSGSETYNVKNELFAAVGDTVVDDAPALQRCIDAVPDYSTIAVVGTFRLATTLTVSGRTAVRFIGPGTLLPDAGVTAVTFSDCEDCGLEESVLIDGGSGGATSRGVLINAPAANSLRNFVYCRIKNVKTGVDVQGYPNCHDTRISARIMGKANTSGSVGVNLASHDHLVYGCTIQGFEKSVVITRDSQQLFGNHYYRSPSSTMDCCLSINAKGVQSIGDYFDGACTRGFVVLEEAATTRGIVLTGGYYLGSPSDGPFLYVIAASPATNVFDVQFTGNNCISSSATKTNGLEFHANVTTILSQRFVVKNNDWRNATVWSNSLEDVNTTTYASNIVVDGMHGCTIVVTLTGNITISNPTDLLTGGIGNRIRFVFLQDGTGGRTVSFDGEWSQAWSNTGNTANKYSSIEFIRVTDLQWVQSAAQSPYV